MTNLQIMMMIHYYCFNEPYAKAEPQHASSLAVQSQRVELVEQNLLEANHNCEAGYVVTDRGRAYVDALQAMPLPVIKWIIPDQNEEPWMSIPLGGGGYVVGSEER